MLQHSKDIRASSQATLYHLCDRRVNHSSIYDRDDPQDNWTWPSQGLLLFTKSYVRGI